MEARGIVLNRERGERERRDRERGKGRKEKGVGITGMSGGCSAVEGINVNANVRYCAVASY